MPNFNTNELKLFKRILIEMNEMEVIDDILNKS